jgi:hypothetical protein
VEKPFQAFSIRAATIGIELFDIGYGKASKKK